MLRDLMQNRLRVWQWLFLLFVFVLPFQTVFQIGVSNTAIQLSDLVLPFLSAAWLFERSEKFRWTIFHSLLAIFVVAMVLSTAFSSDAATSQVKLVGKVSLAAIAFFTFDFVRSVAELKFLATAWTAATAVIVVLCLAGVAFFYFGLRDPAINLVLHPIFGSLPAGNYPRIEGFFRYPAILCNYLSVSLWLALIGRSAQWLRSRTSALFYPALLLAAVFTLTPGLGGIFLSIGLFLQQKFKSSRSYLGYLCGIAGILAATAILSASIVTLFVSSPNGIQTPILDGEATPSHRVSAWMSGLETFYKFPVFGTGIGLPSAAAIYTDANGNRQLLADAHNTFINVLAESGIVGLLAFMALAMWVAWCTIGLKPADPPGRTIRLCLGLALLDAFFYQSLTGSYEDQRHMWVLLGAIAGYATSMRSRDHRP